MRTDWIKMRYRKIMAILLVFSLMAVFLPAGSQSVNAADNVVYTPDKMDSVVFPAAFAGDSTFYNGLIHGNSSTNMINLFGLSFNTTWNHQWKQYQADLANYPYLYGRYQGGDLGVKMQMTLQADEHRSFVNHWGPKVAYGYGGLFQYDPSNGTLGQSLVYCNDASTLTKDGQIQSGTDTPISISSNQGSKLMFYVGTAGCDTCGDATVSHVSMGLFDQQGPSLKSIKVTDATTGLSKLNLKAGDTVDISLEFSESIRFVDDVAAHGDLYLTLKTVQLSNNQSDYKLSVPLTQLVGNKLVFRLAVTEKMQLDGQKNAESPNYLISGISDMVSRTTVNGITVDKSVLYNADKIWNLYIRFGEFRLPQEGMEAIWNAFPDAVKTSSLIVDLAGNPVKHDTIQARALTKDNASFPEFLIDTTPPTISKLNALVERNKSSLAPPTILTAGDTVSLAFETSELLDPSCLLLASSYKATLNLEETGTPVTVRGVKCETLSASGQLPVRNRVTFEPLVLKSTHVQKGTTTGGPLPISIKSIVNSDKPLQDPSGNLANTSNLPASGILPAAKYYLDQVPPVVGTQLTADTNEKYKPITLTGNPNVFYIPFHQADGNPVLDGIPAGQNSYYQAGVNGVKANFRLTGGPAGVRYPLEWAIGSSNALPATDSFRMMETDGPAQVFDQISSSSDNRYLFIRIPGNKQIDIRIPKLEITTVDQVGNQALSVFPLDVNLDRVAPSCELTSWKRWDNYTTNSNYTLEANFSIKDPNLVLPGQAVTDIVPQIKTVWMGRDARPGQTTEWTTEPVTTVQGDITLTKIKDHLAADQLHQYDLYVRATDQVGNSRDYGPYKLDYDLRVPDFTVTYPTGLSTNPSFNIGELDLNPNPSKTMIVMVDDPFYPKGSQQGRRVFYRVVDTGMQSADNFPYSSPEVYEQYLPDLFSELDYSIEARAFDRYWQYATVTEDGDFTSLRTGSLATKVRFGFTPIEGSADYDAALKRLKAMLGGAYYGDLNVEVLCTKGFANHLSNTGTPYNLYSVYDQEYNGWSDPSRTTLIKFAYQYFYENTSLEGAVCRAPLPDAANPLITDPTLARRIDHIPWAQKDMISSERYTLRSNSGIVALNQSGTLNKTGDWSKVESPVYSLTLTPPTGITQPTNWQSPSDGARYQRSLDGLPFTLTLKNDLVPAYILDDLDETSNDSYIALYRYVSTDPMAETAKGKSISIVDGKPVLSSTDLESGLIWSTPLSHGILDKNTFTLTYAFNIPAGIASIPGQYMLVVSAKAKGATKPAQAFYTDLFVDPAVVPSFGLDKVYTSHGTAENPALLESTTPLARDSARVDIGSAPQPDSDGILVSHQHTLHSAVDRLPVSLSGAYDGSATERALTFDEPWIRIWNASEGVNEATAKANAAWVRYNGAADPDKTGVLPPFAIKWVATAADAAKAQTPGNQMVLLKGKENVISYQLALSNGAMSEVRKLTVGEVAAAPQIELRFDPDQDPRYPDQQLNHSTIYASDLGGTAVRIDLYEPTLLSPLQPIPTDGLTLGMVNEVNERLYSVFALDATGNLAYASRYIDWLDIHTATTSVLSSAFTDQGFSLTLLAQGLGDLKDEQFMLCFDDAYAKLLGGIPAMVVPENEQGGVWQTNTAQTSGIWWTKVTSTAPNDNQSSKTIEIKGTFKQDPQAPGPVTRTLTANSIDRAGNSLPMVLAESASGNIAAKPAIITGQRLLNGQLTLDFDSPVRLTDMAGASPIPSPDQTSMPGDGYALTWTGLPAWEDGPLTVRWTDLFSIPCEAVVQVNVFGELGLKAEFNPVGPTSQPVTVTLRAVTGTTLELPQAIAEATAQEVAQDGSSAVVRMDRNGKITVRIRRSSDGQTRDQIVPVTTIDRTPPTATVQWFYEEFGQNQPPAGITETTGSVKAWLVPGDPNDRLLGINGRLTQIEFTAGDPASYTFEYTDEAGNIGTPITAILPITIKAKPGPDTNPPDYTLRVFGRQMQSQFGGISVTGDELAATPLKTLLTQMIERQSFPWTSSYLFDFAIRDASLTRLLVRPGHLDAATVGALSFASPTGSILGVSVRNNTIEVSGNQILTVILVDAAGNKTQLLVETVKVDNEPPTAKVTEIKTDFYKRRSYIALSDNTDPGNKLRLIQMISPSGLPQVADPLSPYDGQWYIDFTDNITHALTFADACGNRASVNVGVTSIDTSIPEATVRWWSPGAIDSAGQADPSLAPTSPVNRPVTVSLSFNVSLRSLEWQIQDPKDGSYRTPDVSQADWIGIHSNADQAEVTFYQNARIRLLMSGQNNKSGTADFALVDIIDQQAPPVSVKTDEPAGGWVPSVTATFTVGAEAAYALDFGARQTLHPPGTTLQVKLTENGSRDYRFADVAGNITTLNVTASRIDRTPPDIVVVGLPAADAKPMQDPVTLYATLNEAGVIRFQGIEYPIAAPIDKNKNGVIDADQSSGECNWVTLKVDKNGYYPIEGVDRAGLLSHSLLELSCFDVKPPTILLFPETLKVKEGTSAEAFATLSRQGVVLQDDRSVASAIALKVVQPLTQLQLDTPGMYGLDYQAVDESGRQTVRNRWVQVYSKNNPEVKVNGVKTEVGETTIVSLDAATPDISFSVLGLPEGAGEPHRITVKAGLQSIGQMKTGATLLIGNKLAAPASGFYTVLVTAQSRSVYMTILYVEKEGVILP